MKKFARTLVILVFFAARLAVAQTAVIDDAWWTYEQDCDTDGCLAGVLPGNAARLNWNPDVSNCSGVLNVYEIIYARDCASNAWTAIRTNGPHSIAGCRSGDVQHLDVPMQTNCACRDYMIAIYRNGAAAPDQRRSLTNDAALHRREESLAQDACLNDSFASCATITGTFGTRYDNNSAATKEASEPDHAGEAGGKSLWYCWTAPTNRPVTIETTGSSYDTLLAVYTGGALTNLSLVASNDDIAGANERQSRVTFTPATGVTYRIAVDGFAGDSGIGVLTWNQSSAALPDLILWPPAVSPRIFQTNFAANSCEVLEGCARPGTRRVISYTAETRNLGPGDLVLGNPVNNPLFEYATCHNHYHFEEFMNARLLDLNGEQVVVNESGTNSVIVGHKIGFCLLDDHPWSAAPGVATSPKYNCGNQGMQAGWADTYPAGLPCQYMDITGVPPGDYVLEIVVNPLNVIAEADTNNNVSLIPISIPPTNCVAPPNDQFTNAIMITSLPFSDSDVINCATKQAGEPNHAGNAGGHSLWYRWTPASNQTVVVTTKNSGFDTLLAVYTGAAVSSLSVVASNNDLSAGNKESALTFAAAASTNYYIAVDGRAGATGNIVLNLNPPVNDDFATPTVLAGSSGSTNAHTIGASKEPGETAHAFDIGGHSIWYQWSPPFSGPVEFNTLGSSFDTTLAAYTNSSLATISAVAANNNAAGGLFTSRLWFRAAAGTTYRVAVDGAVGDLGAVTLNWNMNSRLGVTETPDGGLELTVFGVSGQRYQVQTSTNLINWIALGNITVSIGQQNYRDMPGTTPKFYRTLLIP